MSRTTACSVVRFVAILLMVLGSVFREMSGVTAGVVLICMAFLAESERKP